MNGFGGISSVESFLCLLMFKNDYITTKERNIRELYTQMSGFSNTDIIRKSLMTNGEKVKHSSMFLLACKVYFILF